MIKSMTGFGQAQGGRLPYRWTVEIRAWNHRFFECTTHLPNAVASFDERVRDLIHQHIRRGKVSVSISLKSKPSFKNGLIFDEEKIRFYVGALKRIQKKYGLAAEPIRVSTLLSIPNLLIVDQKEESAETYWISLRNVIEQAIRRLLRAKESEGWALEQDLKKRIGFISRCIERVELIAKNLPRERYERLRERVGELTQKPEVNEERLEQVLALMVERSDITEEVVRTRHHVAQFRKSLRRRGESGKQFDFIAQEIHREVNTMASKAQNAQVAEQVIRMKSELEKIREQVQNVE